MKNAMSDSNKVVFITRYLNAELDIKSLPEID